MKHERGAKTHIAIHSLDEVALLLTERLLMTLEGLAVWDSSRAGGCIQKEGGLGIQFDRTYYCRLCKKHYL